MAIQGHTFWKIGPEYIASKEETEASNHEDLLFHEILLSKYEVKH